MSEIVISHAGVKRRINGAFSICGQAKELRYIAMQMISELEHMTGYGWIEIIDRAPDVINTPPIDWKEPA